MLRLQMTKASFKFLEGVERKHAGQIALKLLSLMQDPNPPDAQLVRGLSVPHMRATVGEYRIIYRIEDDVLDVVLIGKRDGDDVYKQMRRKGL